MQDCNIVGVSEQRINKYGFAEPGYEKNGNVWVDRFCQKKSTSRSILTDKAELRDL